MGCLKRGISFYSYLYEYYQGLMKLEDCFSEAAAAGITGVELLADYMLPGYPGLEEGFVGHWYELLEKYHMEPVCLDLFNGVNPIGNVPLPDEEHIRSLISDLHIAARLGFPCVRITAMTSLKVVEAVLPAARQLNVKLGYEIHPPLSMDSPWFEEKLAFIWEKQTDFVGFIPDMGIFAKYANPVRKEWFIRKGVRREISDAIDLAFAKGQSVETLKTCLEKEGPEALELRYMSEVFRENNENPDNIVKYKEYFFHIHGKFYEMDENCRETSLNYEAVLERLAASGYDGYICSEYEGSRYLSDLGYVESCEQVRRHHGMLKKFLLQNK